MRLCRSFLIVGLFFLPCLAHAGTLTISQNLGQVIIASGTPSGISNSSMTFVQKATDGGTGSSPSASFGVATTAGDLLYVALGMNDATFTKTTLTDACGDTFTEATNSPVTGTGNRVRVYTAITSGGCSSIAYAASVSATYGFVIAEYTNPVAVSYVDCDTGGTGNSTALLTSSPACTTTHAGDTLLAFGYQVVSNATYTAGSLYTIKSQAGGTGLSDVFEEQHPNIVGTYTGSATSDTSGQWTMHMIAVKANP